MAADWRATDTSSRKVTVRGPDSSLEIDNRWIRRFLVEYLVQVVGLGLAFWQAGIFERIAPIWIGIIGALIASAS
jgi:hypothetical protein